jgi:hypothetical protein
MSVTKTAVRTLVGCSAARRAVLSSAPGHDWMVGLEQSDLHGI